MPQIKQRVKESAASLFAEMRRLICPDDGMNGVLDFETHAVQCNFLSVLSALS